jgi:hypothetical protein
LAYQAAYTALALTADRELTEQVGRVVAELDDDSISKLLAEWAESTAQAIFAQYGRRMERIAGYWAQVAGMERPPRGSTTSC